MCGVQNILNITSRPFHPIKSAQGIHDDHKSNDDVTVFYAAGKNTQYIPKGIEKIFRNIQRIAIHNGRLQEIRQEDFKPFPMLTELCLADNDIKALDDGIFIYNPELTLIYLSDNKIFSIGKNVFDKLNKLSHLYLNSNQCIDMKAVNDLTMLKELIRHAKKVCRGSNFWVSGVNNIKKVNSDDLATKVDNLMDRLASLEASNDKKFGRIEEMIRKSKAADTKEQHWILVTIGQILLIGFFQTIVMVLIYRKYFCVCVYQLAAGGRVRY